jgi:hypothetical protein
MRKIHIALKLSLKDIKKQFKKTGLWVAMLVRYLSFPHTADFSSVWHLHGHHFPEVTLTRFERADGLAVGYFTQIL